MMFIARRELLICGVLLAFLVSACTSDQPITEPVAVIEAYYEAMNNGDVDAAMKFVAENAVFKSATATSGIEDIRVVLEEWANAGSQSELTDIQVDGDQVSWRVLFTTGPGTVVSSWVAIVQEGTKLSMTADL